MNTAPVLGRHGVVRVGIVGTGFIARGVARLIDRSIDFRIGRVLTRRGTTGVEGFPNELLTTSADQLIDESDVLFECTGDAIHASEVLFRAIRADRKIVTMDSELQVTTGSWFAKHGYITEADGDQPGCLARLHQEAMDMGFEVRALVNLKGFLNHHPTPEDMHYWAEKQCIRLEQVVSFTDGSKLEIEQALTANGLGATIAEDGMIGGERADLRDTDYLVDAARRLGTAVSDYVVCRGAPPGVMLLAEHSDASQVKDYGPLARLRTLRGDAFMLVRGYHLCHLEVMRTLRAVARGEPPLLNNGLSPTIGVSAIAKQPIKKGARIERALGGFDFRGRAFKLSRSQDHVPFCLLQDAHLVRDIETGQAVRFEDVELPDSRALRLYREIPKTP